MGQPCSVRKYSNIHQGSKIFVIGAGTSLYDVDLTAIHQYPIVCVNSAILLMPWEQSGDPLRRFWISTDILCMDWDYFPSKVMKSECTRIVRNSWMRAKHRFEGREMNYFMPRRTGTSKPNWKEDGLIGASSILGAIDLALLLGAKQVFLLGVDHKFVNGKSHFWELYPVKDRPIRKGQKQNFIPCQRQQKKVFQSNFRIFEFLAKRANQQDKKIYNCSPISEVKNFDKISLEDALKL